MRICFLRGGRGVDIAAVYGLAGLANVTTTARCNGHGENATHKTDELLLFEDPARAGIQIEITNLEDARNVAMDMIANGWWEEHAR